MLVPGWLHGCLGVNFAFGRRPLYQRLRLPLFALALLLPVLGELGFLAMGKELAADLASHGQLDAMIQVEPAAGLALARLRDAVLALYFVAIGLVFAAREVRAWTERRRKLLVQINYPLRRVRVPRGWTVLEASRSHRLPHLSMCGGRGRCTTCRVRVTEGALHCPPPEPAERNALERIGAASDVRLACQLRPTGDIGVLPLLDPERTAWPLPKAPSAAERDLALLAVAWRNRAAFAASHLPQDLVFASQSFAEAATAAARAAHGTIVEARGDSVLAAFGQTGSLEMACRHGLAAAESVARALAALSERHTSAFGVAMDWAVVLHAGRTTIGPLGAHGGLVVAGDALDCVQRLLIAEAESALIVSATVLGHAGVATDPATDPATWREIDGVKVRLRPEPALDRDGGAMGQNRAMPNLRPPAT